MSAPAVEVLRDALRGVADPELAESIVDLGLVRHIASDRDAVCVVLLPTSATCPMADLLVDDAVAALRAICPAECTVNVELDWDTPWHPGRMSEALQRRFGWTV